MRSSVVCLVVLCSHVWLGGVSLASVHAPDGLASRGVTAEHEGGLPMAAAPPGVSSKKIPPSRIKTVDVPACDKLEPLMDLAWQGDAQAQYWLALQYEDGSCGLCKDDPLAVVWFKKAAEAGNAEAQFTMGLRYFLGHGVTQGFEQAVHWLHMAAQQGHAEAQYRLAGCMEDGLGVAADKAAAVRWYSSAAELGYPQAQNMLGILCMNGIGMPRDAHAAAICFLRAAVQGYATAQYNIARSYETGEGVNRDAEKARYWYGKAARQGDADAQTRLEAF